MGLLPQHRAEGASPGYLDLQVRDQSLSEAIAFQTTELSSAPAIGATMKSQICAIGVQLPSMQAKIAGPIERAGFTDVPVIGMQTM